MPALVGNRQTNLPEEYRHALFVDSNAFRVGGLENLAANNGEKFLRYLKTAAKQTDLGAILLVLDGDHKKFEKAPFCQVTVARLLAERAKQAAAGEKFSFAVVFLLQEYESFLIASAAQFSLLKLGIELPPNAEDAPRDAKKWLRENLNGGYSEASQQVELTRQISDWSAAQRMRSFQRFENALLELSRAVAGNYHIVSPILPVNASS
ncbi:DUF4276 family protein [Telmatocola sphagniphila]|uniref:DUF4276 family protein n=1 Tax=Telmatocola sphagniphila TaxID=1123043 RepID=A0A8E6B4P0_9BACT|nr:DUF4276 family protein [Telmatocola sphagniphila]QVL31056.1 DUF4276 family protein [Telmatocola sphagniphila]